MYKSVRLLFCMYVRLCMGKKSDPVQQLTYVFYINFTFRYTTLTIYLWLKTQVEHIEQLQEIPGYFVIEWLNMPRPPRNTFSLRERWNSMFCGSRHAATMSL